MATIREELQAKRDALTAEFMAAIKPIDEELAKTESWLEKEYEAFKAEIDSLVATARGTPPAPPAAPPVA